MKYRREEMERQLEEETNTPTASAVITAVSTSTSRQRNSRPPSAATKNIATSAGTRPSRGRTKPKSSIDATMQVTGRHSHTARRGVFSGQPRPRAAR